MPRRRGRGSSVVAVGVSTSTQRSALGPGSARVPPGARINVLTMQKWEYATVPLLVHATKQILDSWGEDGWELVTVVPGPNAENLVAYLKRPRAAAGA
jgi:hypothetical protein